MLAPIIKTKYLGPTNYRGSRVKASAFSHAAGRTVSLYKSYGTVAYDAATQHAIAAQALAERLGWDGVWYGGDDGKAGYVYVRQPRRDTDPEFAVADKQAEGLAADLAKAAKL